MKTIIERLESALNGKKAALEANAQAKAELLETLNVDSVDTEGDVFAENYARIMKNGIALTSCIADLEQAIFYASRAANIK